MSEREINNRIKELCQARSWTVYRLSKASGITYSTLCTMLNKTAAPSMGSLVKICKGFGITLKQFFDFEDDSAQLTNEEKQHLDLWRELRPADREVVDKFIRFLADEQGNC
jgi:transcriptional regulator with XRE-family HTH domain